MKSRAADDTKAGIGNWDDLLSPRTTTTMSADAIARWNSIPLTRELDTSQSNKRYRSNDDDDENSDDNVSLVSRSPSPQSNHDVEMKDADIYGYDEHVRGVAREIITVETKINSSNKGFAMLAKMGWTEGTPLGISGEGRVDPVPFSVKQDGTGLGKVTQDFRMIETTVSQRRNLDSERMQFETAEQRQQREAAVAQKVAVQSEISNVLRPFYCELCDKQFKNVAQYDEHTNSYAHHHKARARDMNANHPMHAGGREEAERRKEKERKREEKELRKLAKAAGIKLSAPPSVSVSNNPLASATQSTEGHGFKKTGWSTVAGESSAGSASSGPATRPPAASNGGRSSASGSAPPAPPNVSLPSLPITSPTPPSSAPVYNGFSSGGWSTLSTSSAEAPSVSSTSRDGWANVRAPNAPPPPAPSAPPAPSWAPGESHPPPPPAPSPWSRLSPAPPAPNIPPPPSEQPSPFKPFGQVSDNDLPGSSASVQLTQTQASTDPNSAPGSGPDFTRKTTKSKAKSKRDIDEEAVTQSRGNWQSFQKMRGRR